MEKKSRSVAPSLSLEDTEYLKKNTNYSDEDIKIWFRNFKKDCPSGILEKKKVTEIYEEKIVPNKDCKYLVDQLFRIIDDDNNGGIDFKEFLVAVNMAVSGTREEKLRWMFKFYDEDDSGGIDMEEMMKVLTNLYEMEGMSGREATLRVRALFTELDTDGSGELDREEFIQGCLGACQPSDIPIVKIDHVE